MLSLAATSLVSIPENLIVVQSLYNKPSKYNISSKPGEAKFKLHFKSGGAIDFGQAMLKVLDLSLDKPITMNCEGGSDGRKAQCV